MRIVSARRAPTGVAKEDHAPALRHRRSLSSATRALVGGQIAEAVAFGWVAVASPLLCGCESEFVSIWRADQLTDVSDWREGIS
jgi:hypothetical protein